MMKSSLYIGLLIAVVLIFAVWYWMPVEKCIGYRSCNERMTITRPEVVDKVMGELNVFSNTLQRRMGMQSASR